MIRRPPRSTRTDTLLSLHDALPISPRRPTSTPASPRYRPAPARRHSLWRSADCRPTAARLSCRSSRGSSALVAIEGPVARDRHPLHPPHRREIVRRRIMLRGAIVPKDDRARAPAESALDFGDGGLGVEMREQSLAFLCRQAFDMARAGGVD